MKKITTYIVFIIITLSANSVFAQSPFDMNNQGPDLTLTFVELTAVTDLDDFGSRARVLLHSGDDFGFGYEGFFMASDRSGEYEYYWTNNFFVDVMFLEIWWDGYLGFSIGYVFGEEFIGTDSIKAFSAALFLSGPIFTTPDGFPFLTIDINLSSHNLSDPWNYFHCISEIGIYPLGGGLRPLGIAFGVCYGKMSEEEFVCFSASLCFGAYTISEP